LGDVKNDWIRLLQNSHIQNSKIHEVLLKKNKKKKKNAIGVWTVE
jgi:hypothetical protein